MILVLYSRRIKLRSYKSHVLSNVGSLRAERSRRRSLEKARIPLEEYCHGVVVGVVRQYIRVTTISPSRVRPASDKKCAG